MELIRIVSLFQSVFYWRGSLSRADPEIFFGGGQLIHLCME